LSIRACLRAATIAVRRRLSRGREYSGPLPERVKEAPKTARGKNKRRGEKRNSKTSREKVYPNRLSASVAKRARVGSTPARHRARRRRTLQQFPAPAQERRRRAAEYSRARCAGRFPN